MDFKPITLDDRDWITKAVAESGTCSCEVTFGNLFSWGNDGGVKAANVEGTLICKHGSSFSVPFGKNRDAAFDALLALPKRKTWKLYGISENDFAWLEQKLGKIEPRFDREWSDYLYSGEKLATLSGKKLAAKRNHINAFERENPDWHTEDITKENMDAVLAFHQKWIEANREHADCSFVHELEMDGVLLENYFDLGMEGLILYAGDDIVAYSFGEPITPECYCVHVEKALSDVRGAYPLINREFVRRYCAGYSLVNREDDSGEEGLRKAKLSYYPECVLNKYEIKIER